VEFHYAGSYNKEERSTTLGNFHNLKRSKRVRRRKRWHAAIYEGKKERNKGETDA